MDLERYTVKSQEAVERAQRLARDRSHQELAPEHLLSALLEDKEGTVAAVLSKLGVSRDTLSTEANGALDASVLFVAEAVGRRGGAVTGVPLTRDESGKRFGAFLEMAGIVRRDCFVTNAVLCNPLDAVGCNRSPTSAETARCRPFLERTIELVTAPVIVTLGRVALESLRAISAHDAALPLHAGTAREWRGRLLVPMYHPSRQSTLHRPQADQEADWLRLGDIVRQQRESGSLRPATALRYHGVT